jgi:hypothetical protein
MEKIFTIEVDKQGELLVMHLNKYEAEYLRDILIRLIQIDSEGIHGSKASKVLLMGFQEKKVCFQ